MRAVIGLALLGTLVACDDDKPRKSPDTGTSSITATDGLNFSATTGRGVVEEPANTFAIPSCGDSRKIGYLTTPWRTPLPSGAIFTVSYNIWLSEGAQIISQENKAGQETIVRASLHFQRRNDTKTAKKDPYALSGTLYSKGYRQWSGAKELLTPGDHVFSATLTADQWSNRVGFDAAREDPAYAGLTISGNQSQGHGVCMSAGAGYVTIYSLTVR